MASRLLYRSNSSLGIKPRPRPSAYSPGEFSLINDLSPLVYHLHDPVPSVRFSLFDPPRFFSSASMTPRPNSLPLKKSPRPPFDDEDAGITFRSSDDVDFRLYRVILAKASPVFRTMLELPQPSSSTPSAPDEPHISKRGYPSRRDGWLSRLSTTVAYDSKAQVLLMHVVKLTEDAKTLENLLRLCYPVEHPNVTSVDDVHNILEAAQKYEIASITANLRWIITRILPKEPLRIYAIAYMLQMEDVAKEAANLLLDNAQFHIPSYPPREFSVLPCLAIYAVHTYRQKCVEAALRTLEVRRDWNSQSWIWLSCSYGHTSTTMRVGMGNSNVTVRKWFEVYLDALKAALRERPSGRTVRPFPTSAGASEALSQAASCSNCASKAYADLTRFSELLADKVEDAIAGFAPSAKGWSSWSHSGG
ncbi:hypothetical protein LXA43DRAFT_1090787 [Ganoderma leucocontextum]|nr:hypothetical protein LXA43DRAFT_1090787 [Ganoderma leucocontextum]